LKAVTDVDAVIEHWPSQCPKCQTALPSQAAAGVEPLRQQVWELPEIVPTVTEHRYAAVNCPTCQALVRAERPPDVAPGAFGPRLVSLVGLLVGRYRLSHREVADLVGSALGVPLSDGSVTAVCGHVSAALVAPYQAVEAEVEQAAHAHVDETGWKQAGQRCWLWVAVTTLVSLFLVASSRAGKELTGLLGADYGGTITSDRYKAYLKLPIDRRQLCWAHLKRDLIGLSQAPYRSGEWGERALKVEGQIFALWHRFRAGQIDRATLQAEMQPLRTQFAALLTEGLSLPWHKTQGFCADVLALEPALWTFVHSEGIEPTNNAAERALRPAVLWRKGSFGSDSEAGPRFVERLLTVAATCRHQQRPLLPFLTQAVTAHWAGRPAPSLLPPS
jgi:transposase